MKDRIFSGNDIVSGTGTKSVTFTNPFKSGNFAVGITGQGMATGDYFTVSNKTINGFDVAFFNSSNAGVSKTFDFIAKGFLRRINKWHVQLQDQVILQVANQSFPSFRNQI